MIRFALAVPLLALAFVQDPTPQPPPPKEDAKPETVAVRKDTLRIEADLDGLFEPSDRHVVEIKPEGYQGDLVVVSAVPHGAPVKKGDVLLQIDSAKYAEAVAAAKVELQGARTALVRAEEDQRLSEVGEALQIDRLEKQSKDSTDQLKWFQETGMNLELKSAEDRLVYMQDWVSDQEEELAQLEKMYKSEELTNATAEIVVRRAKRNLNRMKQAVEMYRTQLDRFRSFELPVQLEGLRMTVRESAHQADVLKKAAPHNKTEKDLAVQRARAALKQAEETVAKLTKDEKMFTVAAAADGTVWHGAYENGAWSHVEENARILKPGEKLQAGQPLMTLVPSGLVVATSIAEANVGDFMPGRAVQVKAVAFPDLALEGKAESLKLVGARQGENFFVRVVLASSDARLVPGLKAKVHIVFAELKDVLVIPASAVREEKGKKFVKIPGKEKPSDREVSLGRTAGDQVEVKSGLKEGEEILADGAAKAE